MKRLFRFESLYINQKRKLCLFLQGRNVIYKWLTPATFFSNRHADCRFQSNFSALVQKTTRKRSREMNSTITIFYQKLKVTDIKLAYGTSFANVGRNNIFRENAVVFIWTLQSTVWKLQNFSTTQFFREINFGTFGFSKMAIWQITEALNLQFWLDFVVFNGWNS